MMASFIDCQEVNFLIEYGGFALINSNIASTTSCKNSDSIHGLEAYPLSQVKVIRYTHKPPWGEKFTIRLYLNQINFHNSLSVNSGNITSGN